IRARGEQRTASGEDNLANELARGAAQTDRTVGCVLELGRDGVVRLDHEGQRARPERLGELVCVLGNVDTVSVEGVLVLDEELYRHARWALLDFRELGGSVALRPRAQRNQTVYGLGRNNNNPAVA